MLVREVSELLGSIDSLSIPNENRSESLPACNLRLFSLCSVVVGLPTRTRSQEQLALVRDEAKPIHTIGEGKTPQFIAPGERKFDRGLERWKKRLGMGLGVFVRAVCGESRTYGNEGGSRLYV